VPQTPRPGRFRRRHSRYLRKCGIEQCGYRDGIELRRLDPAQTRFFDLPTGGRRIQVVEIFRVAFDQHQNRPS
jgi:hypothetical protein